jgi:hypothetical protein
MCDARNECILSDTGKEKEQHGNKTKTKTKQNKTKQNKTRQDKTRQNKTRQDKFLIHSLTRSLSTLSH